MDIVHGLQGETRTADFVPLLRARGLTLSIHGADGLVKIVDRADFDVGRGDFMALVGESGSGKTMVARAIMRLLPPWMLQVEGELTFEGRDLLSLSDTQMRRLRGGEISMIFQEPMTSLNPLMTVGRQIDETLLVHRGGGRSERRARILQLLADVRFREPERVSSMYPHELSGGMRQRAMIAIALANDPKLLIADEPTTALDVTIQQEIMEILLALKGRYQLAVLFISHDLSLVRRYARSIGVLYAGVMMERGPVEEVIERPAHPYTAALLQCAPRRRIGDFRQTGIEGVVPSPRDWWPGCRFASRCAYRGDDCLQGDVAMAGIADNRAARCVRPLR